MLRILSILLFSVVAVTLGLVGPPAYKIILTGSAYVAKTLCSGVFISGLPVEKVLAEDVQADIDPMVRYYQARVQYGAKTVTASLYGLGKRIAVYRPGLGCALAIGTTPGELRAAAAPGPATSPSKRGPDRRPDSDGLWPEGRKAVGTGGLSKRTRARLEAAIEQAFGEPDPNRLKRTRAVVVVQHGRIVAERYGPGITQTTPLIGWSMSKSATSALVGLLVKQKRLDITKRDLLGRWRDDDDPRSNISLNQLMHMESGLAFDESYDNMLSDVRVMLFLKGDKAAFAADKPLVAAPGARFKYSSGTSNIIARIIRNAVGSDEAYLGLPRRELFEPLAMRSAVFETDASGTFVSSSNMYASARDWARLGLLYLQDGVWNGRQILPKGWVAYTRRASRASDGRYGAQFWTRLDNHASARPHIPDDAFFMLGHDGQMVAMVPSLDLIVVRLGLARRDGAYAHHRFLRPFISAFQSLP